MPSLRKSEEETGPSQMLVAWSLTDVGVYQTHKV